MVLKFLFVRETCKFQTHKVPPVEAALVFVIQTSLNKGFSTISLKVNVTVDAEFLAILGKKSATIFH